MCPLAALAFPRVFLWQLLTVLTRQKRQAVHAINQSIFNLIYMFGTQTSSAVTKQSNEAVCLYVTQI